MDENSARRILKEIKSVFIEVDGKPIIIAGTCLGAVREGTIIPWDLDIDIAFWAYWLRRRVNHLTKIFEHRGFKVRQITQPFSYCSMLKLDKDGVHTDLFSLYRYQDKVYFPSSYRDYACVNSARFFDRPKKIKIYDMEFYAPDPVEEYLTEEFGRDWRIPNKGGECKTRVFGFLKSINVPHLKYNSPT